VVLDVKIGDAKSEAGIGSSLIKPIGRLALIHQLLAVALSPAFLSGDFYRPVLVQKQPRRSVPETRHCCCGRTGSRAVRRRETKQLASSQPWRPGRNADKPATGRTDPGKSRQTPGTFRWILCASKPVRSGSCSREQWIIRDWRIGPHGGSVFSLGKPASPRRDRRQSFFARSWPCLPSGPFDRRGPVDSQ